MSNYSINNLQFNIDKVEEDIRYIIRKYLRTNEVVEYFGNEIYVIPMEVDIVDKSKLPAVEIEVFNNGSLSQNQEDIQIQYASDFTVEINTYTTGNNKRADNIKLAQYITNILQTSQRLPNYYCRGLRLVQDTQLSSIVEGTNRRILRFSARCDNNQKLIYSI